MEFDKIVFDKCFDATFEQVFAVIEKYLDKLSEVRPDAGLSVTVEEIIGKKVWKGNLMEGQDWGKPDIIYGFIEIVPTHVNSITPMQVRLYCSRREYLGVWRDLSETLHDLLKLSDGSPGRTNEPWKLVPDIGYDQVMIKLWLHGSDVEAIGKRIGISRSRVYARLGELRNIYGEEIVPFRHHGYRRKNSQ
jgi:hypothetical protein